jgi:hypothetical protein
LVELIRAGLGHEEAVSEGPSANLVEQPALADAGWAFDEHDPAGARCGGSDHLGNEGELPLPPEEMC